MITVQAHVTPAQLKKLRIYADEIGVKIIMPLQKKIAPKKKEEVHPHILETREHCKRIQNEIIKEYNKTAKVKAKLVV